MARIIRISPKLRVMVDDDLGTITLQGKSHINQKSDFDIIVMNKYDFRKLKKVM